MGQKQHAGFITIIGKPNAGKSTLLNALLGQKLAIVNPKAQTTRHRILGIVNHNHCQMVFSDTPGIIQPSYKLQEEMMRKVTESMEDADVVILLVDVNDATLTDEVIEVLNTCNVPLILAVNKLDESDQAVATEVINELKSRLDIADVIALSAKHKFNVKGLLEIIGAHCPEHPMFYPEDQLTDKTERFVASEIIREKILTHYQQEVPYAVEVVIDSFREKKDLVKISAVIYVERNSQKVILIGKNGLGLKRIGTEARKEMETFLDCKVYLELFVKIREKWRNDEQQLKRFGYGE
ncbi:MAG: GTPase Era [Bacteroidetes bacterium]|nr:GTPase Era [Bacteroidota bacterium]